MRIYPFRGLRYDARQTDPAVAAAPPFDQIDAALRDRLHRREHQFAHLTRPVASDELPAHGQAAVLHAAWLADGVVRRDDRSALYPYEIVLPDGGRRLGLCCLVGLEAPDSGIIRSHERTVSKTIDERLELLAATRIDLEPILLFADDRGRLEPLLNQDMARTEPLVEHRDTDGNLHRLFVLDDPDRIESYREALDASDALIADGHHRYKTARAHAQRVRATPGTAAAGKLAVVTSLASPELSIAPIHRGLAKGLDLSDPGPAVLERREWSGSDGWTLATAVATAEQPSLAIRTHDGRSEIWRLSDAVDVGDLPGAAARLSVVVLHRALLPHLGLAPESAVDGTVTYRSDPDELFQQVARGDLELGIWLPPMPGELFAAATAEGDVLPPKSTRFMPKLVSGLVWSPH